MDDVLATVEEIFRDVLDQPDLVLIRSSNAGNVDDWDSLAHINLVTSIEKRYKVKFAIGELQDLKDVGDMVDLIKAKLAAK